MSASTDACVYWPRSVHSHGVACRVKTHKLRVLVILHVHATGEGRSVHAEEENEVAGSGQHALDPGAGLERNPAHGYNRNVLTTRKRTLAAGQFSATQYPPCDPGRHAVENAHVR